MNDEKVFYLNGDGTSESWNDHIDQTTANLRAQGKTVYESTDINGQKHYSTQSQEKANQIAKSYDAGSTTYTATQSGKTYTTQDPAQKAAMEQAAALAEQKAAMEQAMAQQQAMIDALYQQQVLAKQQQINQTVNSIKSNEDTINNEYQKAQKEAYINSVLEKRNMNDYLQAMGYNGGMAESTAGQIAANYENNRANAVSQRDQALRNNEELIAQARVSGDSDLANLAGQYTSEYINNLNNQLQMNYQLSKDAQEQANADRLYNFQLQQYSDSMNAQNDSNSQNLAAQDFNTFLNTYQGKYNKKSTYEQWIQNLQIS